MADLFEMIYCKESDTCKIRDKHNKDCGGIILFDSTNNAYFCYQERNATGFQCTESERLTIDKKGLAALEKLNGTNKGMTIIDLRELLEKNAKDYRLKANTYLRNNSPQISEEMLNTKNISQTIIDFLLVDFVNHIGRGQGLNYELKIKHLQEDKE